IPLYHSANWRLERSGLAASSVRAASVRSSIRCTAVVTDAPTVAACAANACSLSPRTCSRTFTVTGTASSTKAARISQADRVEVWRCTTPGHRPGSALLQRLLEPLQARDAG